MIYVCTLLQVIHPNSVLNFQIFEASDYNTYFWLETIEVIYVYCFTTGSVRSDYIFARSDSGYPSSGKAWCTWIAAISEAKCSSNLVTVESLLNRGSPVRWICSQSRNCRWKVKSIPFTVTSSRSIGDSIVYGQNRKTSLNSLFSKKYQCWLGSFPSSRGNNQIFIYLLVQELPNFNDCQDIAGSQQ